MKKLLAIALFLAAASPASAWSPPNTYDLQIITGEGHQVTATWRSTEPSHFHCWLTTSGSQGSSSAYVALNTTGSAPRRLANNGVFQRLPCTPPKTYDGLAPGTYTLHVAAFGNESGLRDPTPATGRFRLP